MQTIQLFQKYGTIRISPMSLHMGIFYVETTIPVWRIIHMRRFLMCALSFKGDMDANAHDAGET